ncbi:C40 family peptidase [Streptomyces pathocidini]|uniref:NlpC/P60 family protein n=1 Tax=Streptomyces pathocidini TaxID=1650571 RepID=A0ABW7V179_9ACTN|nr:C40 family peptidase [Streptomyces pathocidini]
MASHRKPRSAKRFPLTGTTARTAATLALAGAAGAAALDGGAAHAEPGSPARIKAEVDRLHHEAEEATERYNGAKAEAEEAARELEGLRDQAARGAERLTDARDELGSIATAQYRSGGVDPAVQLALSSSPEDYLERAAAVDRAGSRQAGVLTGIRRELRALTQLHTQADRKLTELAAGQASLRAHKRTVQGKLRAAERLLANLSPEERARLLGDGRGAGYAGAHADRATVRGPVRAPNARAAQAVAYAFGALGKPYVWGATGPGSYDCSGLTQAAWRSAGVSLPRTTYTQINAGQRVSRSQLTPGDLVFFYSGVSHVGLYVGGGQMIHAPRPGAPVRVAPIDEMPFAGAARPV